MGSHMKRSIFDDQTSKALKKWRQAAKKKQEQSTDRSPTGSPIHTFQHFMGTGRTVRSVRLGGHRTSYSDQEASPFDVDGDASPRMSPDAGQHGIQPKEGQHPRDSKANDEDDFSFAKEELHLALFKNRKKENLFANRARSFDCHFEFLIHIKSAARRISN